jgi:hypothetical protein
MAASDLDRADLGELDWSVERRSEALSHVFDHAIGLASGAEAWYALKRRPKRQWGRALRVSAILLGLVAAVLPIVSQIYTNDDKPVIAPGWAAVALAVAAAAIALDRYFGFSSAWMRFMTSELRLTRLRHDFEYNWQAARAGAAIPPSDGDVARLLALARALVLAVDDVIADETAMWTSEFRTMLENAERRLAPSDQH